MLLAARELSVARGDRVLLEHFSLQLVAGEVVHLKGRNGAGKTSLLEVLAGLRTPASGHVDRPLRGLHWIGHKNALNGDLSVIENLRFWCALQGVTMPSPQAALEVLGLSRLRHRAVRSLSAGQKRRAALLRVLVLPRPLWLLDEPLSALDVEGLDCFAHLLLTHLDGGGAALITSHQPVPVAAGRLAVLELGR